MLMQIANIHKKGIRKDSVTFSKLAFLFTAIFKSPWRPDSYSLDIVVYLQVNSFKFKLDKVYG